MKKINVMKVNSAHIAARLHCYSIYIKKWEKMHHRTDKMSHRGGFALKNLVYLRITILVDTECMHVFSQQKLL